MTKYLLTCLLLVAPLALAGEQENAPDAGDAKGAGGADCGTDCGTDCATDCDDAKSGCGDLATARKDLSTWKGDLKALSRVERNALKKAEKTLSEGDAATMALAPTFGAAADSLALFAALDSATQGRTGDGAKASDSAKLAMELAKTYRAMAQAIAGKDAYPAPALTTADEIKAALKKCEADAAKVKELWAKAGQAARTEEVTAALKLVEQASPRMRALASNSNAATGAMKGLPSEKASPEGDARPALATTAKALSALAAPYFKNVNLEKPEPMAPAPST